MTTTSTSTSTSTNETETETETETGGDSPLQACHELPAAMVAQWIEGELVESSATSSEARITAAGARTWSLALELLRVTDPATHPSLASSPASMTLALGMTHERLVESSMCAQSIHSIVGWDEDGEALYETLGATRNELVARALPEGEDGSGALEIALHPTAWSLTGTPATPSPYFGGRAHATSGDAEGAIEAIREVMNCTIEVESRGLLQDFLPVGAIEADTVAYDVLVAYLGAPWDTAFTEDGPLAFVRDGGEQVELPAMLGAVNDAAHYTDGVLVSVEVPLRGNDLVMQLVMPQPEVHADLAAFVAAIDPGVLAAARAGASQGVVELTMPKLAIDSTTIDYYPLLGFDCEPFTLRKVLHGAAVALDEKGIQAAAATADEIWETGGTGPGEAIATVVLDHPFLFFVYDRATSQVLYSGRWAG